MARSAEKRQHELSIIRDTVESVWVAIILAFVLRAFMVEAFVIPTGSMAPRLMGEHYDLVCPACGYEYSYGWHGDGSVPRRHQTDPSGARCPSCTYRFVSAKKHPNDGKEYVNGGDRVLVMKYLYKIVEPQPFDVVVFRNPQSNANNYIKRLIGLPGEKIEIVHGDVFVTPPGADKPEIRRKPDQAQEVMWQIINDNDYQPDMAKLKAQGMGLYAPRRWEPTDKTDETPSRLWAASDNGRTFAFKGSEKRGCLEFRGAGETGSAADSNDPGEAFLPRYGYNAAQSEYQCLDPTVDFCSDLKLSMVVKPGGAKASVECVLDGLWFSVKAVFGSDGSVVVLRLRREPQGADPAGWVEWARGSTSAMTEGAGRKIALAHVDHGVKVWVDDKKIIDKSYTVELATLKKRLGAAESIPFPGVRIGASGGALELTHLKLMRDVYYTYFQLSRSDRESQDFLMDYSRGFYPKIGMDSPGWGVAGNPISLKKADEAKGENSDFDEFFVLGDNSPQSLDSRGWIEAAPSLRLLDESGNTQYKLGTVPRYNMIGKAMFVYWPSGYRLPLLPGLPIVPDVGRMRLIR